METVAEMRASLAEGRERLMRAIQGVSEEQFKRRPAAPEGEPPAWSVAEVLAHLLSQEPLRAERIAVALLQDGTRIRPSLPEVHEQAARAGRVAAVPQLIHGLLAARRQTEKLLGAIEADERGLDRAVVHPENGRQTVRWLLAEKIIAHEREHVAQIETLRSAMGLPSLS